MHTVNTQNYNRFSPGAPFLVIIIIIIIIIIIWHYNPLWVFAFSARSLQVLLSLAVSFQFFIFIFFKSSMTSNCHHCLGHSIPCITWKFSQLGPLFYPKWGGSRLLRNVYLSTKLYSVTSHHHKQSIYWAVLGRKLM